MRLEAIRLRAILLPLVAGGVVAIVALALASGNGGSGASGRATSASPGTIDIRNFAFDPPSQTVKAGSRITFENSDSATHTATADNGGFDTGNLTNGQRKTVTLTKPGTFSYHCMIHPFMHGTITVR